MFSLKGSKKASETNSSNVISTVPKSPSVVRPKEKLFSKSKNSHSDDTMNIEWVSDKSSKACVLCEKSFHALKRRRHHCRQCGRVVCNACSLKRLILQSEHFQGPQRVCDGCFLTLTEKKYAKQHASSIREKEELLLKSRSYISDSLLRVFLLDGSSVTISYDDCSTIGDLTERICFSVRCALFEVEQDIRDRDQYILVHCSETLVDVMARWALKASTTVKLVLPLYDLQSAHASRAPPAATMRMLRMQGSLAFDVPPSSSGGAPAIDWEETWHDDESSVADSYRSHQFAAAMEESGMVPNIGSASGSTKSLLQYGGAGGNVATGGYSPTRSEEGRDSAEAESPQPLHKGRYRSNCDRLEFQALQKKYDLLKNIHSRQTQQRTSLTGSNIQTGRFQESSFTNPSKFRGESYDLFDDQRSRSGRTSPLPYPKDDASVSESSFYEYDNAEEDSVDLRGEEETSVSSLSDTASRPHKRGLLSRVTSAFSSSKNDKLGSVKAGTLISPIKQQLVSTTSPLKQTQSRARSDSSVSTQSVRPGPEMMLLSPKDVQSLVQDINNSTADFQQLVRTFFHQATSVENFLLKFHGVIRTLMSKEEHNISESLLPVGDKASRRSGQDDTYALANVFEMTWALEGLYAFVLGVAEEWSDEVRCWLLTLLKKCLTPPLTKHTGLRQITEYLQRMDLLHSPLATSTIQNCVDRLFDPRITIPADRTPSLLLDSMNSDASAMRTTLLRSGGSKAVEALRSVSFALNVLVEDLLPSFPADVGLLSMCLTHTARIVQSDVLEFFKTNKQHLLPIDVLTLLSFAQRQRQTLSHVGRLGTDLPVLHELEQESLRQYLAIIDSHLRQNVARVHTADEKAAPKEMTMGDLALTGLMTNWPLELLRSHGDQISLIARYLQPQTREVVWTAVLDTLPDFVARQKAWVMKFAASASASTTPNALERFCAYINNHQMFAEALESKLDGLSSDMDDKALERITAHYHRVAGVFLAQAEYALQLLNKQIVSDFQKPLRQSLFKSGWETSVQAVHTAKKALSACKASLFSCLRDAKFASAALGAVVVSVCELHIELMLISGLTVTASLLDRLQEDFNLWQGIFQEYVSAISSPADLADALTSWKHIITALSMDTRNMPAFVRNDLYPSFGLATIKILATVMQMRGDSKQVVDTLTNVVLQDWNPKPITTPKCNTQAFIGKLKGVKLKLPSNSIFNT